MLLSKNGLPNIVHFKPVADFGITELVSQADIPKGVPVASYKSKFANQADVPKGISITGYWFEFSLISTPSGISADYQIDHINLKPNALSPKSFFKTQ